jgi:hypothetical protein
MITGADEAFEIDGLRRRSHFVLSHAERQRALAQNRSFGPILRRATSQSASQNLALGCGILVTEMRPASQNPSSGQDLVVAMKLIVR